TRSLLCTQHERRCGRDQRKLDNGLLMQARSLATITQFQFQGSRTRLSTLAPLGILSAGLNPSGYVQVPVWLAETRGPLNQRVHRLTMGEIQSKEVDLPTFPRSAPPQEDVSPVTEYFQIISEWGNNWHSHTLDQLDFPNDPEQFTKIAMFDFKFDDCELAPGT